MKQLFKIIIKLFQKQIEDLYIQEQLLSYTIDFKDKNTMEKLAELYTLPEFKLYIKLQSNKKNNLGKKALECARKRDAAKQLAFLSGEAYNISASLHLMRYINRMYQKRSENKNKGK